MSYTLQFNWPVEFARDQLRGPERADFDSAVQMLRDGTFASSALVYPADAARGDHPTYIARVNGSLRLLFEVDGQQIHVRQIARREMAEQR